MGRSLIALGCALALGCNSRRAPPTPAPSAITTASAAPRAPLPERAVSDEVAFELLAVDDGAVLAWGQAGGGLGVAVLDATGHAQGEPLAVIGATTDPVVEIAGATLDHRVGLAWVTRSKQGAASFGALGDAATKTLSPAFPLAEASLGDPTRRGHVDFAVSDQNQMVALTRERDESCDGGQLCAAYRFRELLSTGPELRGLPATVPSPCSSALAGFALVGERWHYAFCSRTGDRPQVTAFMRQEAPFYVGLSKPGPGCEPLGALAVGREALYVHECADGRRGLFIGGLGDPERSVDLSNPHLECVLGRPRLTAPGAPPLSVDFTRPLSRLGPVLPSHYGGPSARAAWTGSALLVASWVKKHVTLRRFECRGAELVRTG